MIPKAGKEPKAAKPVHICRAGEVWGHFLCAPCTTRLHINLCSSAEQIQISEKDCEWGKSGSRDLVIQEMTPERPESSQGDLWAPVSVWFSVETVAKSKQACGNGVSCRCKTISTKLAVIEQMSVKIAKQISPHLRFLGASDSCGVFLEGDPRRMSVTAWLAWTP